MEKPRFPDIQPEGGAFLLHGKQHVASGRQCVRTNPCEAQKRSTECALTRVEAALSERARTLYLVVQDKDEIKASITVFLLCAVS